MIYSSYPDFNKTPKEFLATIIQTLMQWPEAIIYQIADKRTGIQTKEMFPPNVAAITKIAEEIIAKGAERADLEKRYGDAQARRRPSTPPVLTPFRPFPKLWEAFADEPEIIAILDKAPSFASLDDAGRALATRGKDAARQMILPAAV